MFLEYKAALEKVTGKVETDWIRKGCNRWLSSMPTQVSFHPKAQAQMKTMFKEGVTQS